MTLNLYGAGGGRRGKDLYEHYVQVQTEDGLPVLPLREYLASLRGPAGVEIDPDTLPWTAGALYAARSVVQEAGSIWMARRPTTGERPSVAPDAWSVFVPGVDLAFADQLRGEVEGIRDATAEAAAEQVAQAAAERQAAETARAQSEAARAQAVGQVALASAEALRAEAAATAATMAAEFYDTIALGRAAVADGASFGVRAGGSDGLARATIFRRDSAGAQTEIVSLAPGSEIDAQADTLARERSLRGVFTGPRDPRLGIARVLLGLIDPTGRSVGFDEAGGARAVDLTLHPRPPGRRSTSDYELTISTTLGMLLGFLPGGRAHMAALRLGRIAGTVGRLQTRRLLPVLSVMDGASRRVILGINDEGLPELPGLVQVPEWRDPATMRGAHGQFNLRRTATHYCATVQTRGLVCDVLQRRDITVYTTAVALGVVEITLVIGQSTAGAESGPAEAPQIPDPGWPHHILKTEGSYGLYGTSDFAATLLGRADLRPYVEPAEAGQSPAGMLGLALAELEARDGRVTPRAYFTAWEGSQPITSFFPAAPGHWNHENAVNGLKALVRVAGAYQGAALRVVLLIQGENGTAGYADSLRDWIDTVLPLYGAAVGQATPHLLLRQINRPTDASGPGSFEVELAQLAVARERLGAGVTLTGPMYHLTLGDMIHPDNIGKMMGGEMDAVAQQQAVTLGLPYHAPWPVAGGVTRAGAVITVPFALCAPQKALVWSDYIAPAPNRGFAYSDAGSGATIASVAIAGASVVITLTADPGDTPGKTITYAGFNAPGVTGWASARGELVAETGLPSPIHQRGFAVPPTIQIPSVRFRESLT